jgi:hypothetical protein
MTECVISDRKPYGNGYCYVTVNGKRMGQHRAVWMETHGKIPPNGYILHSCDTPTCINVEHLFLGTHAANMTDMAAKGRQHNQLKTHCPWGHEYTEENTRTYKGKRWCRTCDRLRRH